MESQQVKQGDALLKEVIVDIEIDCIRSSSILLLGKFAHILRGHFIKKGQEEDALNETSEIHHLFCFSQNLCKLCCFSQ